MRALCTKTLSSFVLASSLMANLVRAQELQTLTYFKAQNSFAHQLLQKSLEEADKNENIFLSPLSANLALSMLLEGARGATKEAMLNGLGLPTSLNVTDLHQLNANYVQQLQHDSDVTIDINNAIWADRRFPLQASFVDTLANYYQAKAENADFKRAAVYVAQDINQWASASTNGKISNIVQADLIRDIDMLLANATYFKGTWKQAFAEKLTSALTFHTEDAASQVETMYNRVKAKYWENGFQAIRLPYQGKLLSMYVILPPRHLPANLSARQWTANTVLNEVFWNRLDSSLRPKQVRLWLPKLRIKSSKTLNKVLSEIGFSSIFAHPDLSGLSSTLSRISFVKQDTFVQVDEKGTEAAAVTTTGLERSSSILSEIKMQVNRPFFMAIRDDKSKNFIFMGFISKPEWQ